MAAIYKAYIQYNGMSLKLELCNLFSVHIKKASRNGLNNTQLHQGFSVDFHLCLAGLQLDLTCGVTCQVRFHSQLNECSNLFIQWQIS